MSATGGPSSPSRRAELVANLAAVRQRIERACAASGRSPDELTVVVVSKKFPVSDLRLLADLGVTDIGENRDQEAGPKVRELRDPGAGTGSGPGEGRGTGSDLAPPPLTVHFVGQLQTNKAGSVVGYADVIHAVDRPRLVTALETAAARARRRPKVLVQVSLDGPGRGGVRPAEAPALASQIATSAHLELSGVMGVAPLGGDPDAAFARLRTVAHGIQEQFEGATWISAGMSGDLEAAISNAATHLRVGTAILGSRPSLR